MNKRLPILIALCILCLSLFVMAADYTPTGSQDFNVYIDPQPELSGKVYATVSIDQSLYPGDAKCVDMLFWRNGSKYLHVQSNPTLASSGTVNLRIGSVTPEEKGYFDIKDGIGTIYFRDNDVMPYTNFTFVVLCNVGNTSLVYEENVNPVWRVAFKTLPSRTAWAARSENMDMIVIVGVVFVLMLMFIWYRFVK